MEPPAPAIPLRCVTDAGAAPALGGAGVKGDAAPVSSLEEEAPRQERRSPREEDPSSNPGEDARNNNHTGTVLLSFERFQGQVQGHRTSIP